MVSDSAITKLKAALARISHDSTDSNFRLAAESRDAKEEVIANYGTLFQPAAIDSLTAEDFRGFLLLRNNHHWDSLHRQGGHMTADMDRLREALKLLVDESIPLQSRLNEIRPRNQESMVKGMGRAVVTAILQVVYPDKYGVLNNTAEAGMKTVGLWPEFPRGASFGERYETVNGILLETASQLNTDLWTLDILWWLVPSGHDGPEPPPVEPPTTDAVFGLERYLHEFLVDNWQQTTLGSEWHLLDEDGEIVGSHYQTGEIGEIDLLAKHKCERKWLVVELKRNQSSDATVGQLLRYMGWVRRRLAAEGEEVSGLIICGEPDARLRYALDNQPNIECMTYLVNFTLSTVPNFD